MRTGTYEKPFGCVVMQATLMLVKMKENQVKEEPKYAIQSCSFQSDSTIVLH